MNTKQAQRLLAASSLFVGLELLTAGCKPAVVRRAETEHAQALAAEFTRCIACVNRSCPSEVAVCKADAAPAIDPHLVGVHRCDCLETCRVLHSLPWADCIAKCGTDSSWDALASCWDVNCTKECPKLDLET
jgi:hypothetical protein